MILLPHNTHIMYLPEYDPKYTSLWTRFLIFLGFRSACCAAPVEFRLGFNYKHDGWACTECGKES